MSNDSMTRLLQVMETLRSPDRGCPWDIEQTFESLIAFTLEEAYEVADCIERGDYENLLGELGDLLFQVVFYAQIGKERDLFDFDDIVDAIANKLVSRHPHVFEAEESISAEQQSRRWEELKANERRQRYGNKLSVLADVPLALPALMRAQKLQKRAARVGFDWPSADGARSKIMEELAELAQAQHDGNPAEIEEEFGDLLFSCVNLSRFLGLDSETALRAATAKFEQRFRALETELSNEGLSIESQDLDALERRWETIKRAQKKRAPKHP